MPSELEIGRLIGGLRVDRGLTQRKLAELAGTNHTYLSKIENGRLGTLPSAGMLVSLADVLEVARDWLLTRCGRPPEGMTEAIESHPDFFRGLGDRLAEGDVGAGPRCLRLVGDVPAGLPVEAIEDADEFDLAERFAPDGHFLLRVRGESMIEEGIRDGALAIVRSQPECENGGVAVVLVDGAEATLKRVYRDRGGPTVTLQPANAEMQPLVVAADRVEVRGIVVGIVRLGL